MVVPKYAQSCNDIDLNEIERCYSDVIGQDKENIHAECTSTRNVQVVLTILAEVDHVFSILDILNGANFLSNLNIQLPGILNDIFSAGVASLYGNLI